VRGRCDQLDRRLGPCRATCAGIEQEHLRQADDPRQGRLQVMRDRAGEGVELGVLRLQSLARGLEIRVGLPDRFDLALRLRLEPGILDHNRCQLREEPRLRALLRAKGLPGRRPPDGEDADAVGADADRNVGQRVQLDAAGAGAARRARGDVIYDGRLERVDGLPRQPRLIPRETVALEERLVQGGGPNNKVVALDQQQLGERPVEQRGRPLHQLPKQLGEVALGEQLDAYLVQRL